MCDFLSAIATRDGRVLCEPMLDSHTDLIAHFGIRETTAPAEAQSFVRIEYTPKVVEGRKTYLDFSSYTLRVDEMTTPAWFDAERFDATRAALSAALERMTIRDDRQIVVGRAVMVAATGRLRKMVGGRLLAVEKGANLAGADLAGAYLAGAYLAGAYLAGADLTDAYLALANLAGANLARADLTDANLAGAYLAGAYLAGADLAGANLARADLTGADLAGADLAGADRPEGAEGWKANKFGLLEKA